MMKKILNFVLVAVFLVSATIAYSASPDDNKKTRRERKMEYRRELSDKASKLAQKDAKDKKEQGWLTFPSGKPLEYQIERLWLYSEENDDGEMEYIVKSASSVGSTREAAHAAALHQAKVLIAGDIEVKVGSVVESGINNHALSDEVAESMQSYNQVDQAFVNQNLRKVITLCELYRKNSSGKYEVEVTIAVKVNTAVEDYKEAWLKEVGAKNAELRQKLSEQLGW